MALVALGNMINAGTDLRRMLLRFPIPAILALGCAALSLALSHGAIAHTTSWIESAFASLVIGFFFALAAALGVESWRQPRWLGWLIGGGAAAATFALLAGVTSLRGSGVFWSDNTTGLLLGEAAVLATLAAAHSRLRRAGGDASWRFVAVSLEGAAIAFVGAVLLALGISLVLVSVAYLFAFDPPGRAIGDTWIVALSLVCPWRALATVPAPGDDHAPPRLQLDAVQRLLADWVLVPLWIAYAAVLYAYAAKIALLWELPRGNVAWMVHGFGALGVALWLVAWPRRIEGPALTRLFHRWFFPSLVVPLALLAVGTIERVQAYGWTEPRYLVALGGGWLAAMATLFTVWRERLAIQLLPLSLAVLCLLASAGPWGATAVSLRDQQARLAALLGKHRILVDGTIDASAGRSSTLSRAELDNVASMVDFFTQRGRLDLLEPWFKARLPWSAADRWAAQDRILAAMGLRVDQRAAAERPCSVATAYGASRGQNQAQLIDTSGFDQVAHVVFVSSDIFELTGPDGAWRYSLILDRETAVLALRRDGVESVAEVNLASAIETLCASGHQGPSLTAAQSAPALIDARSAEGVRMRVAIEDVHRQRADAEASNRYRLSSLTIAVAIADKRP